MGVKTGPKRNFVDMNYYTDFTELEKSLSIFNCGKHLLSFLKCMLHRDKKKRSTPADLFKHLYTLIGNEFYEKGTINMTQLLSAAVDVRLVINQQSNAPMSRPQN